VCAKKYIRYILNAGGKDGRFFSPFYSPFLNDKEKARAIHPTRQDWFSGLGTKAAPLLGPEKRGRVILFVSYRNVSAALSLLNKVFNSIYSNHTAIFKPTIPFEPAFHPARFGSWFGTEEAPLNRLGTEDM
jgi:hypothetical protein